VMESVEAVAGMVGPALGGILSRIDTKATLSAVMGCYSIAFIVVLLFFDKHVARAAAAKAVVKVA
jgi:hypothetical protein